jgi:glutathione peroxidase
MNQNENAYMFNLPDIYTGENILASMRNKFSLFVNISTKAEYSPTCSRLWSYARTARQLWELQELQNRFSDKGFSVIAVPCNQFNKQEPAENSVIGNFIKSVYPFVNFPVSQKIDVNGKNEHPLYTFLKGPTVRAFDDNRADGSQEAADGQNKAGQAIARVPHNYEKFLVGPAGNVIARFNWADMPLATQSVAAGGSWLILEALEEMLS